MSSCQCKKPTTGTYSFAAHEESAHVSARNPQLVVAGLLQANNWLTVMQNCVQQAGLGLKP